MKTISWLIICFLTCIGAKVFTQPAGKYFVVAFKNKTSSPFHLNQPEEFLSEKAIRRRLEQNIAMDSSDLPLTPSYLETIAQLPAQIIARSKWMNSIVIATSENQVLETIRNLSFVDTVFQVGNSAGFKTANLKMNDCDTESVCLKNTTQTEYGASEVQNSMLNLQFLHQKGYRGKNISIAILDGGFKNADQTSAFANAWQNGQIKGTFDLYSANSNVFDDHHHGTNVFSILAAYLPNELIGTSTAADYYLIITENTSFEQPVEMEFWIYGAELADSLGTDIISSSLGYQNFDIPYPDILYSATNGKSRISLAATLAAKKGILVVNSAGNSGNDAFLHITAPADANNILAVGSVNAAGQYSGFSSIGPSADGRIKPEVAAQGQATAYQTYTGQLMTGNGTSYACPIIAGFAACLWQNFPKANAAEIRQAIIESASQKNNPDIWYGYGIPNAQKAFQILSIQYPDTSNSTGFLQVIPNPFVNNPKIYLYCPTNQMVLAKIFDASGREILKYDFQVQAKQTEAFTIPALNILESGLYYLQIKTKEKVLLQKIVKNQ